MKRVIHSSLFVALLVAAFGAAAQAYPTRPIKIVVPYPPGGTTDVLSRLIGQKLSESVGQPVVIENRPGANATIATNVVAKAEPDGHTLGMFLTTHTVNPAVTKDLPYDTLKDFAPITLVAIVPGLMVTNIPDVSNLKDALSRAKASPGKLNYASPGPLTSGHLSMELLKYTAGVNIIHIPYKGGAPALMALLSNEVQFAIAGPPTLLPHVKTGKLRAIAVTTRNRIPTLPDVPAISEQGFPEYETYEWYGLLTTAGTPRPVIEKLNRELVRIIKLPEVRDKIIGQGAEPQGNSAEEFGKFIAAEITKWGGVASNIKLKSD